MHGTRGCTQYLCLFKVDKILDEKKIRSNRKSSLKLPKLLHTYAHTSTDIHRFLGVFWQKVMVRTRCILYNNILKEYAEVYANTTLTNTSITMFNNWHNGTQVDFEMSTKWLGSLLKKRRNCIVIVPSAIRVYLGNSNYHRMFYTGDERELLYYLLFTIIFQTGKMFIKKIWYNFHYYFSK